MPEKKYSITKWPFKMGQVSVLKMGLQRDGLLETNFHTVGILSILLTKTTVVQSDKHGLNFSDTVDAWYSPLCQSWEMASSSIKYGSYVLPITQVV